jgi:heme/copper-type cytochrome/quinol oxidase subunit 2
MTTGRRIALLVAVVVIAVVGFIILKPSDTSKKAGSAPTTATTAAGGGKTSKAKRGKPATPPVAQIKVRGGKPVGGVSKIRVNKGDTVRFAVTSDVGDEVHVHGYDLKKDVKPGGKVTFSFPAKIDGVFEIELEKRAEQIASLEVQP